MQWQQKEIDEVIQELESFPHGLSTEEAGSRLAKHDPNELREKKKRTPFLMFLDQFRDFMILVLISAAIISGIIGDVSDTIAIVVIEVLNAIVGFVQEYQLGNVLAIRSERESLFTIGLFSNKPLVSAVAPIFFFQMAAIYIPALNPIFRTQPLSPGELALALAASSLIFIAVELENSYSMAAWDHGLTIPLSPRK